jgi:uncharacterized protein involved in exopolysaccharide biosynthesis
MPSENNRSSKHEFLISLQDILYIVKRNRKKIVFAIVLFATLASLYTLSKPISYTAESSFREKSRAQAGVGKSFTELLVGVTASQESEAAAVMKSRDLISILIRRLGLQGKLIERGSTQGRIKNIYDNLWVQLAYLTKRERPIFKEESPNLILQGIEYTGEQPLVLTVKFLTDDTFTINGPGISNETRWLGAPILEDSFRFTFIHSGSKPLKDRIFFLTLMPMDLLANKLSKSIKIKPDKLDKTLLILSYTDQKRSQAKKVLNELMAVYQDHLKDEHNKAAQMQLEYLHARQEESFEKQIELMEAHALSLADDISTTGIADTEKEMEFFLKQQQQYAYKLDNIILEIKRLEHSLNTDSEASSLVVLNNERSPVHQLLQNSYELKQQRDSLSLALRQHNKKSPKETEENFIQQANDLEDICTQSDELGKIILSLAEDKPLDTQSFKTFQDPQLLINHWYHKIEQIGSKDEKIHQKEQFLSYLNNLYSLFEVHRKLLEERLAHHYNPQQQFEGISLETASQLYMIYSKEYDKLEGDVRRDNFILTQMEDPAFEICSLASVLDDSVSRDIIKKSSELSILLRDENNRSHREHERVRGELEIQKRFLKAHLSQSVQIIKLNTELIQEKMLALQNVMLGLIHQNISVLQKQITDYISSRLDYLYQEQELINKHLTDLHQRMARIPNKWVWEQIVKRSLTMNQTLAEEITRLVEGKNISHHLEIIQSAPIDQAYTYVLPDSPKLALFVLIGAFIGSFFSVSFLVTQALVTGVRASEENLKLAGQQVAGYLSSRCVENRNTPLLDQDLETFRRITTFLKELNPQAGKAPTVLLVQGCGIDYAPILFEFLNKKGFKVLTLPLTFDQPTNPNSLPGLLQYLQDSSKLPKITKHDYCDSIATGGIHRFASDLVDSSVFTNLISKLRSEYDFIFAITKACPVSAEADSLIPHFDAALVTLINESITDLNSYFDQNKPTIFVFNELLA